MLINLTPAQLRKAADLKEQIESLNQQLNSITGVVSASPAKVARPVKKGGMSAAGRARIIAAQKLRWAKINAAKAKPATKITTVKAPVAKSVAGARPKISAAGIARIKAAQKARWAKIHAAKAKVAPKAVVKVAPVARPVVKVAGKPAKKFIMSAAAKAKISAAAKARWAKIKAAKKK